MRPQLTTALVILTLLSSFLAAGEPEPACVDEFLEALETRHWVDAVEQLAARGDSAVPALLATLETGEGRRAAHACEALARIGGEAAVAAVGEASRHEDVRIRREAVYSLRHFAPETALPPLTHALVRDSDPRTRRNAVCALGELQHPEVEQLLLGALADQAGFVRISAAQQLSRHPTPEVAEALASALHDPEFGVREQASAALADFGDVALPALSDALLMEDPEVRRLAVWSAARLDHGAGLELVDRAAGDASWMVRNEAAAGALLHRSQEIPVWPTTSADAPSIPSPHFLPDGRVLITARTLGGAWTAAPASPDDCELARQQSFVDGHDFPSLARRGLHDAAELAALTTVTGRSLAEITILGRPGGLSGDGFMAADEDILSVLCGDNELVERLGLTHPELARPLMQVWNMVLADASADRWNMAEHRWQQFAELLYNGRRIEVVAGDTKGGQLSIFDDGLEGAFWIEVEGRLSAAERQFLATRYDHLDESALAALENRLTSMLMGELEPHYIQRYGFYEGHTGWRTDPLAIAFTFGLRSLEQIEDAFPGELDRILSAHFTR